MSILNELTAKAMKERQEHQARIPTVTARMDEDALSISMCGPGWEPLLIELVEEMEKISPNFRIAQYKEKFGRLTVYLSSNENIQNRQLLNDVCNRYGMLSESICEMCGAPGKLDTTTRLWIKTLCNGCWSLQSDKKHIQDATKIVEALLEEKNGNQTGDSCSKRSPNEEG